MQSLSKQLISKNITISSTESFTVGGFANLIGSIPGISKVYKGSLVCYQNEIKEKVLKIDKQLIDKVGVVSKEVAYNMAKNGRKLFNSDICISFTGNSGPEPMENKPVGMIYLGIAFFDDIQVYQYHFEGNREEIKNQAINKSIELLIERLKDNDK